MDQIKIGAFLKTLRKEKNLTQEQAAEQLGVSNRTVSRWETGTNMPDISLLLVIAELYSVSIPELIEGERKSEKMNEEAKEVASRMSDYAESEKTTILKNITTESPAGRLCAGGADAPRTIGYPFFQPADGNGISLLPGGYICHGDGGFLPCFRFAV